MFLRQVQHFLIYATLGMGAAAPWSAADDYDPLAVDAASPVLSETMSVHDQRRQREIPIRVYRLPAEKEAPVLLFSHGLGGSRDMGRFLGEHWARRHYVVVFLQHPGSDESIWKDVPPARRAGAFLKAASGENLKLRVEDVPAVIDQLEKWNRESGHVLANTMDLKRIGMSGHSFGAQTTQAVSGQEFPIIHQTWTDRRILAAVIMSPGPPKIGADKAFSSVTLPWMLMTGTEDVSPIGGQTVESRREVYPALPPGDKYELVLDGGKHSAFTDVSRRLEQRNPTHHRSILAVSTAFWDAYLKKDPAAKTWLTGDAPRKVLDPKDIWQRK
ncbi:MAG: dienelactone hydrolase [Planctomycetaceae bacterium]